MELMERINGQNKGASRLDLAALPGEPFFRILQHLEPHHKMLLQSVSAGLRDALQQPQVTLARTILY